MIDSDTTAELRVRPYLVTRGRTKAAIDLPIEAQIRATTAGQQAGDQLRNESAKIVNLCTRPLSVAEIAAHVGIHLQVAKILVGDLVTQGLVSTGQMTQPTAQRPDLRLLERVLDGLQTL